ncbi:MAG TPA: hypothetical protein VGS23_00255 [Thermoplasmata archaeon]|nr:hypothetical protein [Thermoplasmata archaeon]
MRLGLVVVGIAFLAVAAASATSLYLWPRTPSTQEITTELPVTFSAPNQTREALLSGTSEPAGSFTLDWQASAPFDVELFNAPGCARASVACEKTPAVAEWPANLSGHYEADGALAYPYLVVWTEKGPADASLQATAESVAQVSSTAPAWTSVVTDVALASLGSVGALSLFLGLFLRGGVFARGSDQGGVTGPRTGSPDGEDGSPRPGPPSPGR